MPGSLWKLGGKRTNILWENVVNLEAVINELLRSQSTFITIYQMFCLYAVDKAQSFMCRTFWLESGDFQKIKTFICGGFRGTCSRALRYANVGQKGNMTSLSLNLSTICVQFAYLIWCMVFHKADRGTIRRGAHAYRSIHVPPAQHRWPQQSFLALPRPRLVHGH